LFAQLRVLNFGDIATRAGRTISSKQKAINPLICLVQKAQNTGRPGSDSTRERLSAAMQEQPFPDRGTMSDLSEEVRILEWNNFARARGQDYDCRVKGVLSTAHSINSVFDIKARRIFTTWNRSFAFSGSLQHHPPGERPRRVRSPSFPPYRNCSDPLALTVECWRNHSWRA
jgi:hypothetical protein